MLSALTQIPRTFCFSRSDDRLGRPLEHDDDVVIAPGAAPVGFEDRAVEQQFGAGEALPHLDLVLGDLGHQDRIALAR